MVYRISIYIYISYASFARLFISKKRDRASATFPSRKSSSIERNIKGNSGRAHGRDNAASAIVTVCRLDGGDYGIKCNFVGIPVMSRRINLPDEPGRRKFEVPFIPSPRNQPERRAEGYLRRRIINDRALSWCPRLRFPRFYRNREIRVSPARSPRGFTMTGRPGAPTHRPSPPSKNGFVPEINFEFAERTVVVRRAVGGGGRAERKICPS